MTSSYINISIVILSALAGGSIFYKIGIPGGIIIGSMISVIIVKFYFSSGFVIPQGWKFFLQVFVGAYVGLMFEYEMIATIKSIIIPVIISALALIFVGIIVAVIMVKFGIFDPGTAYISTSPGAMMALIGMAASFKVSAPIILVFHFVRIVLVIILAPIILHFLKTIA